jgi:cysteine desulfurase family protein
MIYFDNAATVGFKPRAVTDAAETVIRYLSANPGRSGHRLSITGAETVYSCRELIGKTFSTNPDKVIFTKNCTEALNLAIFGSLKVGGHVITTTFEHNSVLRPLFTLKDKGLISLDVVSPTMDKSLAESIKEKINTDTYMVVCTAVSNVTGDKLPLMQIGKLCAEKGLIFLVDGAQGGGHIELDIQDMNITYLALAGHKGLYGIMGSGILIMQNDADLEPLILGGTGSESFNLTQPKCYPERLESGTLNLPAIAALKEGVAFMSNNRINFANHLTSATATLIDGLNRLPNITCYSSPKESGIVSFEIDKYPSSEVADLLNSRYDVAVRGGFHCAPLTHQYLQTNTHGLVRVSLAVQNSSREINYFLRAIADIIKTAKSL